jgi:hypothetical protein
MKTMQYNEDLEVRCRKKEKVARCKGCFMYGSCEIPEPERCPFCNLIIDKEGKCRQECGKDANWEIVP